MPSASRSAPSLRESRASSASIPSMEENGLNLGRPTMELLLARSVHVSQLHPVQVGLCLSYNGGPRERRQRMEGSTMHAERCAPSTKLGSLLSTPIEPGAPVHAPELEFFRQALHHGLVHAVVLVVRIAVSDVVVV